MLSESRIFVHSHFNWWLKARVFPELSLPFYLNDDPAHADKGKMYKEYLSPSVLLMYSFAMSLTFTIT